ncbi:hypothetical protein KGA66_14320 [Actinocrinis puniceicyclus]|uniref:Uncharacterized protein n=1 Tax=Actinocrinis puniceicyclus TaxID=977794 RepID=A0A8J7WKX4_9ACTN|nr:hypothetical protein [Actinocrinis puniceicyclus]MBS2964231.1 hypothetical protein [Actinocrinis puniceicyclus]
MSSLERRASMKPAKADIEQTRLACLAEYGPALEPWLAPGETLRAVVSARVDTGIREPPRKLRPKIKTSKLRTTLGCLFITFSIGSMVAEAVTAAILGIPTLFMDKPWRGGWKSQAGEFLVAAFRLNHDYPALLIAATDRRLLVTSRPGRFSKPHAAVIAEYTPGQLRNRPKPPPERRKSRADVAFPDASWITFFADKPEQADLLRRILA